MNFMNQWKSRHWRGNGFTLWIGRVAIVGVLGCMLSGCADVAMSADEKSHPPAPHELVQIDLAGTDISELPNRILIVAADPHEQGQALAEHGANVAPDHDGLIAKWHGVQYMFASPDDVESFAEGIRILEGEVMYIFHFDRDDDAEQWVERWDLGEPVGHTLSETGEQASPIFAEAPGIYISPQVAQKRHYCPMHPEEHGDENEACDICGMDFVPGRKYFE